MGVASPLEDVVDRIDHVETLKYFFEAFKHLSTLTAGALILTTAVVDRLFEEPDHTYFVGVAFASLLVCLVGSLFAMFSIARAIGHPHEIEEGEVRRGVLLGLCLSFLGFGVGLFSIAEFVFYNL